MSSLPDLSVYTCSLLAVISVITSKVFSVGYELQLSLFQKQRKIAYNEITSPNNVIKHHINLAILNP